MYADDQDDHHSDESGSGTRIGSPLAKGDILTAPSVSLKEKANVYLLAFSFLASVYLLFLTTTTASKNMSMLSNLKPYAVDVSNVTNKTWGYGDMPVKVSSGDKMPGHDHGGASPTVTALNPEDTTILYGHMWNNGQDEFAMSIFPTTSDTLDEERPDEVVKYDMNFLVKKHVSTVLQYNRRITANDSYRSTRTTCVVQAFMPPLQSLQQNKTLITSNAPIDIFLLSTPPNGPWWAGKDFIKNGNYTLRSNMTWRSKPSRVQKLGTVHAWPGMNLYTSETFECPKITGRTGERIAVEYACTPGATEESCFLSLDAVMRYPILLFEVMF